MVCVRSAVTLLLIGWASAIPSDVDNHVTGRQNFFDFFRDPRWFLDGISDIFPTRQSISDSVSQTFTRSSFDQAMQVLSPEGMNRAYSCVTRRDSTFRDGLCLRPADCLFYGGASEGGCAGGILGTCCVFERRCDQNSDLKVTYFTNPRHPTATTATGECKLTINPMDSNVCQYRLDFEDFYISSPDGESDCSVDFFGVTGGSPIPRMCGDLHGQHFYVHVKPGAGPITLDMDTSTTRVDARSWRIKVTQIHCDDPEKAPDGCTQFYNTTSGSIRSLNFHDNMPDEGKTRQLRNLQYGICINSKVGYCKLTWKASQDSYQSFSLSGDSSADPATLRSEVGQANCRKDYVIIPGGTYNDELGVENSEERYCGTRFPQSVTTSSQPYRLYVRSDGDEHGDKQNSGFKLDFRHSLC